jgi:hypothetical protein
MSFDWVHQGTAVHPSIIETRLVASWMLPFPDNIVPILERAEMTGDMEINGRKLTSKLLTRWQPTQEMQISRAVQDSG